MCTFVKSPEGVTALLFYSYSSCFQHSKKKKKKDNCQTMFKIWHNLAYKVTVIKNEFKILIFQTLIFTHVMHQRIAVNILEVSKKKHQVVEETLNI